MSQNQLSKILVLKYNMENSKKKRTKEITISQIINRWVVLNVLIVSNQEKHLFVRIILFYSTM